VENLPDVDIVLHLAAFNGTKYFYSQPFDVMTHNLLPTQYLLERYAGKVSKFIFSGTSETYAGTTDIFSYPVPTDEKVPLTISDVLNPRWSYGGSKIANELQVVGAHSQFGQDFIIIRYHNVYGPEQTSHFIPEFIERIKKGDSTLHGYDNTRSFIYIDDAVSATIKIMFNNRCLNQIIHVGNDDEISIKELAEKIMKKLNIDLELVLKSAPEGSTLRRCPDITKLKQLVNYKQTITIDEGISKIIKSL
jgi:nucleoside-diphosphate-sugar epimerase